MRFRQVHLDFHTSEKIPDVGSRFDPKQFQEMLRIGNVDSITVFSKCHHGLSYHETKVGVRHPHLAIELLARQIEACREIDVKTPIYISAGYDEAALSRHPEWSVRDKSGKTFDPTQPGFKFLCFNSPYLDYLCAQIEEVVDLFGADDGIFLDIILKRHCYCAFCVADREARGWDICDDARSDELAELVLQKYYARATAACRKNNDARRVFHNSGHIPKGAPDALKWNSHLELESLPTGGWGYDHFPLSAKYAGTLAYDFLGMTGKFHTTWGEFGGFKRSEALRYECAAMQAFGARCSVGDQLHPSGEMNRDTYELIGAAYREVQEREEFCTDAKPVCDIALVSSEAAHAGEHNAFSQAEEGAARMLLEMGAQFEVVDLERDLSSYKVVILPDEIPLAGEFLARIEAYFSGGGKLLMSGNSGLNPEHDSFALNCGLKLVGKSEYDPDYIFPSEKTPTARVRGAFVIHGGAWNVEIEDGQNADILAALADSYFNREWNHFCSHQHAPDSGMSKFPAIVGLNNSLAYFAHGIFTRYRLYGQPLYRDVVQDALAYLLPQPALETGLPSAGRASLTRQENRYILHLLYATPALRGAGGGPYPTTWAVEVIEDLVPLHEVFCTVRVPETVTRVRLVPEGKELEFERDGDAISFVVPRVLCSQMVELRL